MTKPQSIFKPHQKQSGLGSCIFFFLAFLYAGMEAYSEETKNLLSTFDLEAPPAQHWRLPKALKEISGLAMNSSGALFAHNDEAAIIFQIDWTEGRFIKTFSFGNPTAKGDFEGLAIIGDRFFLITSMGFIYEAREGANGARKIFNIYDSGLKKKCEVEGLASDPVTGKLFILCKKGYNKNLKGKLSIFSWDIEQRGKSGSPFISIELKNPTLPKFIQEMEPTSLEVLPGGSGFLVASLKNQALLEISILGEIKGWKQLIKKQHPQTEGITISPKGDLIISDEGSPGRLAIYAPLDRVAK